MARAKQTKAPAPKKKASPAKAAPKPRSQRLREKAKAAISLVRKRRSALASTFVAGLQLAKDGQIELRQTERFGTIHLRKRTEQR